MQVIFGSYDTLKLKWKSVKLLARPAHQSKETSEQHHSSSSLAISLIDAASATTQVTNSHVFTYSQFEALSACSTHSRLHECVTVLHAAALWTAEIVLRVVPLGLFCFFNSRLTLVSYLPSIQDVRI